MSPFIVVAFAVAALQSPSPARAPAPWGRVHATAPRHRARGSPPAVASEPAADLYSARARRRLASLLRLKLLEMRKAGLERVTHAIEREMARPPVLLPLR